MKKIFAVLAAALALTAAGVLSHSCAPVESGDVLYSVEVSFFDNMDILTSAIDKGFEDAGFTAVSTHIWLLRGEKNACNKKAKDIFLSRCEAIDKDRNLMAFPLALKGETVKLSYTFSGDHELSSYTFVEED